MIEQLLMLSIFLIKVVVVGLVIVLSFAFITMLARKKPSESGIQVTHVNEKIRTVGDTIRTQILKGKALKSFKKHEKAQKKEREKEVLPKLWLIDFKGDISASQSASLRKEITLILSLFEKGDEVAVRIENPGGSVHEHGFAASQLLRLKEKEIPVVALVDKVAASGGYLMATVADKIIAAPFAIIGSIGVVAQLPNFNRWLEKQGVDFEQVTAGKHKRTLTMFGKNTDEGREKLKEDLEEIHVLFKNQIQKYRPSIDIEKVATGEYWYGTRALELGLVDSIQTSDDYLLDLIKIRDIYKVEFKKAKKLTEKLLHMGQALFNR
jgi:serine protease SohB